MGSSAARLRVVVERLADRDANSEEHGGDGEAERCSDETTAAAPLRAPPGTVRLGDAHGT